MLDLQRTELPEHRRQLIKEFLFQQLRNITAGEALAIDERQPLIELGINSLMAVELRNSISL